MFKVIKRIIIFIIAAFTALILFACVSSIVDPLTEEEQKAAEQQMQEMEEQSKLEKEQKEKEKEQKKKEKEAKKLAAQEKKDAEKAKREKEKIAKEKAKAEEERKKKEQEEREKELEEALKDNAVEERRTNKLVKKVEPLIPSIYKEKSTFSVYASTPTDKSIKGLFLTIQPVNTNFTNEKYCKYAAVEILENIKNVKDINKITFNFVDAYNIKYKLYIEDWAAYKEKGISEKTLKLIKAD